MYGLVKLFKVWNFLLLLLKLFKSLHWTRVYNLRLGHYSAESKGYYYTVNCKIVSIIYTLLFIIVCFYLIIISEYNVKIFNLFKNENFKIICLDDIS